MTRSHVNRWNFRLKASIEIPSRNPAFVKYLLSACKLMWTFENDTTHRTENRIGNRGVVKNGKGRSHSQILSVACKAREKICKNCICNTLMYNIRSCIARLRNCMWSVVPFEVSGPPGFKPIPQYNKLPFANCYFLMRSNVIQIERKVRRVWYGKGSSCCLASWVQNFRQSYRNEACQIDKVCILLQTNATPSRPKHDVTQRT